MSFDEWLLALHVLSAFAYVAGARPLLGADRRGAARRTRPTARSAWSPLAKVGNAAVGIGAGGTIILGIWLAFSVGGYDIWDPWIIAALVLWALAAGPASAPAPSTWPGMTKAEELEAAGQTGPSAELLAINRTQRGLVAAHAVERRRAPDPHRHDLEAGRMTSVLAAIRPDSWNFPLFVHVLGAMILVGGLLTGASALAFARGDVRIPAPRVLDAARGRASRLHRDAHRRASGSTRRTAGRRPAGRAIRLDRHRLHRRRRRRPARSHRADPRRDRRPPSPRRQGHRPPEGDDGDRAGSCSQPPSSPSGRCPASPTDALVHTSSRPEAGSAGREAKRGRVHAAAREGGSWGNRRFHPRRTTTGSTPGSPRSAVRYRARRSPCGAPCSAHHPTFGGLTSSGKCHSAARYLSFSHSVTWTRYSSHSRRLSSM